MNPVELIRKKKRGERLAASELREFVGGYLAGTVADYQMSAFLMAVHFAGMDRQEAFDLTDVMLHSGVTIDQQRIPSPSADKHSTGGVGDKVSLILAPMVASCGVSVPMISGRGLGHTGGTLDKLESIPGFRTELSIAEFESAVAEIGLAIMGQTEALVPADRKLYALRDVTATVESIPLIAGSIMSKKLAEGIEALVLDVKTGNGAFMREEADAVTLAKTLVEIGSRFGKKTLAFVTSMNEPLGSAVGNWLEVEEAIACLRGRNVPGLSELTYVLGGAMLYLAGKSQSIEEGMKMCRSAIWSGVAYEKFLQFVERQGGDLAAVRQPSAYPRALHMKEVRSTSAGYVAGFKTRELGVLSAELGAGRLRLGDVIDPKAGIVLKKKRGDRVEPDEPLATLHTDRSDFVDEACRVLAGLIDIRQESVKPEPLIIRSVDESGERRWTPPVQY